MIKRSQKEYQRKLNKMVDTQIAARGVKDPAVLAAMKKVPRHIFVGKKFQEMSYADQPLPIGYNQTISQPYIVAFMTEALQLDQKSRVLEVGTGCGYQTAVLAQIAQAVYSVEIVPELVKKARQNIAELGLENVRIREGNGRKGWPEQGPYSHIMVTAASQDIPPPLVEQLQDNGRMIIPVGDSLLSQNLQLVKKQAGEIKQEKILPVRFVPLVDQ